MTLVLWCSALIAVNSVFDSAAERDYSNRNSATRESVLPLENSPPMYLFSFLKWKVSSRLSVFL